ncbi:MAG: copper resistance protein NlpE [Actinobacteria bacterium]|nr:copper resistance protein NlpE [Actinomycetota bacterium]
MLIIFIIVIYNYIYHPNITYKGITPCADCPGIEETITFYNNKTYADKNVYQERNTSYTNKGTWEIIKGTRLNPDATIYQLTSTNGKKNYYILDGNKIRPLDPELNEFPSPYNTPLTKQ